MLDIIFLPALPSRTVYSSLLQLLYLDPREKNFSPIQDLFCSRKPLTYPGSASVQCGLHGRTDYPLSQALTFFTQTSAIGLYFYHVNSIHIFSAKLLICSQTFFNLKYIQKLEILYKFDVRLIFTTMCRGRICHVLLNGTGGTKLHRHFANQESKKAQNRNQVTWIITVCSTYFLFQFILRLKTQVK